MANLTKAEKYNRNLHKIFDDYRKHQESIPNGHLYDRFLEIAEEKLKITKEQARKKYGLYTVKQWQELLNLNK